MNVKDSHLKHEVVYHVSDPGIIDIKLSPSGGFIMIGFGLNL